MCFFLFFFCYYYFDCISANEASLVVLDESGVKMDNEWHWLIGMGKETARETDREKERGTGGGHSFTLVQTTVLPFSCILDLWWPISLSCESSSSLDLCRYQERTAKTHTHTHTQEETETETKNMNEKIVGRKNKLREVRGYPPLLHASLPTLHLNMHWHHLTRSVRHSKWLFHGHNGDGCVLNLRCSYINMLWVFFKVLEARASFLSFFLGLPTPWDYSLVIWHDSIFIWSYKCVHTDKRAIPANKGYLHCLHWSGHQELTDGAKVWMDYLRLSLPTHLYEKKVKIWMGWSDFATNWWKKDFGHFPVILSAVQDLYKVQNSSLQKKRNKKEALFVFFSLPARGIPLLTNGRLGRSVLFKGGFLLI